MFSKSWWIKEAHTIGVAPDDGHEAGVGYAVGGTDADMTEVTSHAAQQIGAWAVYIYSWTH